MNSSVHELNTSWENSSYVSPKIQLCHSSTDKWRMHVCVCSVTKSWPTLCDPMDCRMPGSCFWDFPGKNTGVGCYALLEGIFLTQESNPHFLCLLHWKADSLPLSHLGSLENAYRRQNEQQFLPNCQLFLYTKITVYSVIFCSRLYSSKMVQRLWKRIWQFLKKWNIELSHESAILFFCMHSKELKIVIQTNSCAHMFIAALYTRAKGANNLNAHQSMSGPTSWGISIQWSII